MGLGQTKQESGYNLAFLSNLFGRPKTLVFDNKKYYIWTSDLLRRSTIFKNKVVYDNVVIKSDEPDMIFASIKIFIPLIKQEKLLNLSNFLIYNRKDTLWIGGKSIDDVILLSKYAVDEVLSKSTGKDINQEDRTIENIKTNYLLLLNNVLRLKVEKYDPYFRNTPHLSNHPQTLAAIETEDSRYYQMLDDYPFLGHPPEKKEKLVVEPAKECKGNCLSRYDSVLKKTLLETSQ